MPGGVARGGDRVDGQLAARQLRTVGDRGGRLARLRREVLGDELGPLAERNAHGRRVGVGEPASDLRRGGDAQDRQPSGKCGRGTAVTSVGVGHREAA